MPTFSIDLWPLEGLMLANFVMEFASEPFPDLRMYICIRYKGGRSTKKFRSSANRKSANITFNINSEKPLKKLNTCRVIYLV